MSNLEPARQRARALLREGRVDAAARLLFESGLVEEAATAFAEAGRFEDAITLLCGRGRVDVARIPESALPLAARLLDAAGRLEEAAAVHSRLGQDVAHDELIGRASQPAPVSARRISSAPELADPIATSVALERQGNRADALRLLYRIPHDHALYRTGCHRAIELAMAEGTVDFDLDHFLARFLRDPITSQVDLDRMRDLAGLYERAGFLENAREVIGRIAAIAPNDAEVRRALARLDHRERGDRQSFDRVVRQDEGFRRVGRESPAPASSASSETFPSLPELPPPPAKPARSPTRAEALTRDTPPRGAVAGPERAIEDRASRPSVRPSARPSAPSPEPARPVADKALLNVFEVPPGFVIGGRYEVDRRLGRGGMAAVYKVRDREIEQDLALKLFAPTGNDATQVGRFKQELVVARQLTHANIVRLYDLGTHGHASFITMELLEGADLGEVIDGGRDLLRDLGYLVQTLEGLEYAHERGVVHRDLKPENLFVTTNGHVKVMDFGIAKHGGGSNLTQAGFSAGTPAYMSPEQVNDFRSATHLSDLYSIGVIAYRLFTGALPFESESPMAVLMKQLRDRPAPPSSHDPNIPDELEFLILQLLEKEPARRVQSCRELARDLMDLRTRLANKKRRR